MKVVAVVGLGYVGLPLAVEFGQRQTTIGFDLSAEKVAHYRNHFDPTGEVSPEQLEASTHRDILARPLDALLEKVAKNGCFIDVKSQFDALVLRDAGLSVWRL